jgi:MacB-like protein
MAIPLSYNFRNLRVRKTTTVMTALGIALTVAVLLGIMAMVAGLKSALQSSGNPLQMIVVRKNSASELVSQVAREAVSAIRYKDGIQKFPDGEPMVSPEIVTVMNLPRKNNPEGANVTIRGLSQGGVKMRPEIRMISGRWFEAGQREVAVGKSIASRFVNAAMGDSLRFGRGDWKIVGVFDDGRRPTTLPGSKNGSRVLRRPNNDGAAGGVSGHVCRGDHGRWEQLRGDEHDVCSCGAAGARDWHFTDSGVFAGQHSCLFRFRVIAPLTAWGPAGHHAGTAAQRPGKRHWQ